MSRPQFKVRHCSDHRQCWLIHQWSWGGWVPFMHLTAPFQYAIDVVDRAVRPRA